MLSNLACSLSLESTEVSAVPAEVVDAKSSVEGSPVAAHIFTSLAGIMDQMTVSGIMMLGSSRALWRHTYFYFIATSKVLHCAVDITRSSSLPTSTWTCPWGYGRHARLVLPLQRNSHPHCTCENAARSSHRYIHIRPEVVGWAPPV